MCVLLRLKFVDLNPQHACVSAAHNADQLQDDQEEEEEEEVSVELQMEDMSLTTLDLREHEVKPVKKKRRKKKERKLEATEKEGKPTEREGIVVQSEITVSLQTNKCCQFLIDLFLLMFCTIRPEGRDSER